jgi:GntR family transcriptional regulator
VVQGFGEVPRQGEDFGSGRLGAAVLVEQRTRVRQQRGRHAQLDDLDASGCTGDGPGGVVVAARTPAPEHIALRLAIEPGDPCVVTRYEFMADGWPVQLSESWEPMAITGDTPIGLPELGPFAAQGVVERMRSIGVTVAKVVEVPRPARATQE